jgi:hypothetical protein
MTWYNTEKDLPPVEGKLLECTTPTGDVVELKRSGNLYFIPDSSMYVYYKPVMWRYKQDCPCGRKY